MNKASHLERVLQVVETVARNEIPLSTAEICEATGLPAPTVYRLVRESMASGLLTAAPDRRYAIGKRLKQLAYPGPSDQDMSRNAKPILRAAANQHRAAFFLSRARGRGVEIIDVQTPQDQKVSYLHPGLGFRPVHACSCAKAVAAFSEHGMAAKSVHGELRAYTDFTHTDAANVEAEFEQIRKQGYAECVQELELGICSVAAPVFDTDQDCEFSIGATGSIRLFTESYRKKLGKELITFASQLEVIS
jgi:DNA-binding IclR family transcriptional regulator